MGRQKVVMSHLGRHQNADDSEGSILGLRSFYVIMGRHTESFDVWVVLGRHVRNRVGERSSWILILVIFRAINKTFDLVSKSRQGLA